MKRLIRVLLIAGLAIITAAQANEPSLDQHCTLENQVTWPVLKAQAAKAPDIYMLVVQGWKMSDVLREIELSEGLWVNPSVRSTAMYMAAYMDDHADKFRELSDEQMIDWWTTELKTKI